MDEMESLSHTKWECKYHVVFIPKWRRMVEELQLIEQQIGQLDQEMAARLRQHPEAVQRLAETPGLGVDSAQQIITELGLPRHFLPESSSLPGWEHAPETETQSCETTASDSLHRSDSSRPLNRVDADAAPIPEQTATLDLQSIQLVAE